MLTSNTCGHVLEQRQRQVARAMDAVLRCEEVRHAPVHAVDHLRDPGGDLEYDQTPAEAVRYDECPACGHGCPR